DHPALMRNSVQAEELSWVEDQPPAFPFRCMAKTRYRQADQACALSSIGSDKIEITFDQPQRAITPGQALVLYDNSRLIGGGVFCDLING
ncbi:MAG: aminomethyltransferase beta-barrel domain-containing protein, partial [Pseudomonadota bacterium]|nr:aminomethyltransferase beta-barrel domain-containing protein [Pseudomonadota bacterium]